MKKLIRHKLSENTPISVDESLEVKIEEIKKKKINLCRYGSSVQDQ